MAHVYALAELVGSPSPSPTVLAAESCPAAVAGAPETSLSGASPARTAGARLRYLIALNGFKGRVVARRLGINPAQLSRWMNDLYPIPERHLEPLAAILGTTVESLTCRPAPPPQPPPVETKICTFCRRELPLTSYQHDRGRLYPRCKDCKSERLKLQREVTEPTRKAARAVIPRAEPWEPHLSGSYVSLCPTLPMSGMRPRVQGAPKINGRFVQAYGPVGRIADL